MRSHLASRDMHAQADNPLMGIFVRMLGLGVKNYIDFAPNPSRPRLGIQNSHYLDFGGEPLHPSLSLPIFSVSNPAVLADSLCSCTCMHHLSWALNACANLRQLSSKCDRGH